MKYLVRALTATAGLAAILGVASVVRAQVAKDDQPLPAFGMGLVPVDEATYKALPTVQRFRDFLPAAVDLSDRFPQPGYQGQQGSCSAWATTYAAHSFLSTNTARQRSQPAVVLSPYFVFNQTRTTAGCARGASLPDSLNFLQNRGAVPMSAFAPNDCSVTPPPDLGTAASQFRIGEFRAVAHRNDQTGQVNHDWRDPIVVDDIRGALARSRPVVFAMKVPSDFLAPLMGFKGVYQSTERYDRWGGELGGMHAMAVVGYDNAKQAFRIINSWGTRWGDGGYLWMDYDTFRRLAGEAYVIEPRGETMAATPSPQPPAPPQTPETLEQRLTRTLAAPICGRVTYAMQGNTPVIQGFARPEDLAALQRNVQSFAPAARFAVRATPFPACEAELTLLQGLSIKGVRLGVGRANATTLTATDARFRAGETFSVEVETTPERPYVQLFYVQADGSAVELYRGLVNSDGRGRRAVRLGGTKPSEQRFEVAEPFGSEVIVALASTKPVIAGPLGTAATERDFLTRLRAALATTGTALPAAAIVNLQTLPSS